MAYAADVGVMTDIQEDPDRLLKLPTEVIEGLKAQRIPIEFKASMIGGPGIDPQTFTGSISKWDAMVMMHGPHPRPKQITVDVETIEFMLADRPGWHSIDLKGKDKPEFTRAVDRLASAFNKPKAEVEADLSAALEGEKPEEATFEIVAPPPTRDDRLKGHTFGSLSMAITEANRAGPRSTSGIWLLVSIHQLLRHLRDHRRPRPRRATAT
jgi:hypothetical protein